MPIREIVRRTELSRNTIRKYLANKVVEHQRCLTLWAETAHPQQHGRSIAKVYAEERDHLMALPCPFDGFIEHIKRVSPTCLIMFERNRYSVPASYANRPISLRVYADRLVFVAEALNLLKRLIEPAPPPPVDAPSHLRLVVELIRYDQLREVRYAA